MSTNLTLVSHHLCPYVQRAAIALQEKNVSFERVYVDLADKPDWFEAISPLGKVPVLLVKTRGNDAAIFESAVILEYLEETQANPLHPRDPLRRSEHRSWIEFASSILNDIAGLYRAVDQVTFERKVVMISEKFRQLERRVNADPHFDGSQFSLVDATFGPVFRYFDVFDQIGDFGMLRDKPGLSTWRTALARRESVANAVAKDYEVRLWRFLERLDSHLSRMMPEEGP